MSSNKYIKSKRSKVISYPIDFDREISIPERNLWLEVYWKALHDIEFFCERYDYYSEQVKKKYVKKHRRYQHEVLVLMQMTELITAIEFIFDDNNRILDLCFDNPDYFIDKIKKRALELLSAEPRLLKLVIDLIN